MGKEDEPFVNYFRILLLTGFWGTGLLAQTPANSSGANTNHVSAAATTEMAQQMHDMDAMAKSMTSMAEMCKTMMEKEMHGYGLKAALAITLGTALFAAL